MQFPGRPRTVALAFALGLGVFVPVNAGHASAEPGSLVFINGRANRVFFNDGDSFRVLGGSDEGTKARLGGFNTLENFGPAHSWGDWHPFELYVISKQATLNARRGVWHCTTEGDTDSYGRVLMYCPDLIVDQIRKGLAMAYNIDDTPSPPEYLRAQQEAIRARRGMWAKGVPAFIMTSIHSADEGRDHTYNRMISTRDGHTEKWEHDDTYRECARICAQEDQVDEEKISATARKMRADPALAPLLKDWFNLHLEEFAARYARKGQLPEYVAPELRAKLAEWLETERLAGNLGEVKKVKGACMLFVQFERWYGADRAPCLKDKKNAGTAP